MIRDDLVQAIEQAIGALQPVYRNNADESDLYEASLLVVCLDAARRAGGTAFLTQDGKNPATELWFRRSPGNLWSGEFTHALVRFPGTQKMLEIHLGVYVAAATSKVAHECDVAILDQQAADVRIEPFALADDAHAHIALVQFGEVVADEAAQEPH